MLLLSVTIDLMEDDVCFIHHIIFALKFLHAGIVLLDIQVCIQELLSTYAVKKYTLTLIKILLWHLSSNLNGQQNILIQTFKLLSWALNHKIFLNIEHYNERHERRINNSLLENASVRAAYLLWYPLIAACSYISVSKIPLQQNILSLNY